MVRKAGRLAPTTKSVEEVMLQRIAAGATNSATTATRASMGAPPAARATSGPLPATAIKSMNTRGGPALLRPTAEVVTNATVDVLTKEVEELHERLQTMEQRMLREPGRGNAARGSQKPSGTDDVHVSTHQREIDQYLAESTAQLYDAFGPGGTNKTNNREAPKDPRVGARVHSSVRELRSTVQRLDRVFYDVASGDKQRHLAATKMAMICRGFVVRCRYQKLKLALGAWRRQRCDLLLTYMGQFAAREEFLRNQIAEMYKRRIQALEHRVIAEMRDLSLMNMPLRRRRLEETERRFQQKQRVLLRFVFGGWKAVAFGPRARKKVSADSKLRHQEARQRLEAMDRFDVITTEMIHEEFLKENIRIVRGRHQSHIMRMYFHILVHEEYLPMKAKTAMAIAHDRRKVLRKIMNAWLPVFRAAQVDKAIARVSERRTLDRFEKHYNMRKIDAHYRRSSLLKHLRAWGQYCQRIRRVRKLFEVNTKDTLVHLLRRWNARAQYQRRMRDNAIEEWKAYSRRIYQTPFRAWYVYSSERKASRVAKESICYAYERRQRRHIKYTFFRLWKHQVLFGSIEGIHSKVHLLRSLEDQKRFCLGLEANAKIYQENIAALQASILQMEAKLTEKQIELTQLHDTTQVTRFSLHHAEHSLARVQGMMEAVRLIHPGSVERIEKMYKDHPLLTRDLKEVMSLHIARRTELLEKLASDDTQIEVLDAAGGGKGITRDDQLLLHRVKWVLSRIDLGTYQVGKEDVHNHVVPVETMNQLCALFEFVRTGEASALTPENSPFQMKQPRTVNGVTVFMGNNQLEDGAEPPVVRRHDLVEASDTWCAFLQALTIKFAPEKMLTVKERLVRRMAAMEEDIAELKEHPHVYNLYSSFQTPAQVAEKEGTESTEHVI